MFYARGVQSDDGVVYEGIGNDANVNIKIVDQTQTINPEKTVVKITIQIESDKDVDSVLIGGKPATKVIGTEDLFDIDVTQNGNYDIVARDVEGNTARESIYVSGIGSNGVPTVTATVNNSIREEGGVYILNEKVAKLKLESSTATQLFISREIVNQENITDWLAYAENVEKYFDEDGDKTLYVYVKDENGNWNEEQCIVNLRIVLDETARPTYTPPEIRDGDIIFARDESIPEEPWNRHEDFAKFKSIIITYPEGMQGNGYKSLYKLSTSKSVNWNESNQNKSAVRINTNNTTINAKIEYSTVFASKTIKEKSYTVTHIDTNPPTITSLEVQGEYIVGEAVEVESDTESGLSDTCYMITDRLIDFDVVSVGAETNTWGNEPRLKITDTGKYYFYARDNCGNVAVKSIYAEAPDIVPPVVDSIVCDPKEDDVILRVIGHDNVGVVAHQVVKGSGDVDTPTNWEAVEENLNIVTNYTVSEDGDYTVFLKDKAGNIGKKPVHVITNKFPVLDDYPIDAHVLDGTPADFEVRIKTPGYPDVYNYQWCISKDKGVTWTEIEGANAITYRTPLLYKEQDDGNMYKCKVTNDRGTLESKVASVEVVIITPDRPSIEVTLDKTLVLSGVKIDGGAEKTSSDTLTLNIAALHAYEVELSETGTFTNTNWQKYSNPIQYTLQNTTAGTKTIYARIRDDKGIVLKDYNDPTKDKVVSASIQKTD